MFVMLELYLNILNYIYKLKKVILVQGLVLEIMMDNILIDGWLII